MLKPLPLFIGLRYTRAKRRNRFVSFISLASIIGLALGVAVLITVLSVMNGFDKEITERFFAIVPQVTIYTPTDASSAYTLWNRRLRAIPDVKSVAPFVNGKGFLLQGGDVSGLEVMGIDPKLESSVFALAKKMTQGNLNSLQPNRFHIVIGQALAQRLGVKVGDKVNLFTPQFNVTLIGTLPVHRVFTISGLFHTSAGFGFDNAVAYINLHDAQKLFAKGQRQNGLHVKLSDLYLAPKVSSQIQMMLPNQYLITNWTIQSGAFIQALKLEKTMLFLILMLIVAVAVFNLVSTLVMVVNDKQADIAILRTLGASRQTIMGTVIVQGAIIGLIGTLLGLVLGLILSYNATAITNWLQAVFHVQLLNSSVYFVNFLPSKVELADVIQVCFIAFVLCLLATLYPAWVAYRTQPAEALRYE